ncbi:MAG: mannosyl-3-phosphoglycerate synthase [Candidatus Latescibacteria bacterium]|nr:mannosyl-3-phosphoglycerate synthase [Candidatus Latescibacterota bacterium]NIM64423.1 mannosyl-3-phosphoglycerate synthase [Candidatus Latescibacterota bacterium]NIO00577.1 mannosyl-3-phosphoglycerate synthase [Candidatus Latescibacterota bacterium]NIO26977.1 mannosyl-3-phosphoglycerate synthase [Candidatus Latescibacterota bacterium]NIO56054.1 mannosyl-3-phosphoglycerate synthase [Candidatus Latescibacterota bacterium]
MRLELPKNVERFGAIRFGDLQKVFELDAGPGNGSMPSATQAIQAIPHRELYAIFKNMAIIIPVRSERLKLIEGVLSGVPHPCLIIVVSNSPILPIDRFSMEQDALNDFCNFVGKSALIVHQKDPNIARAFEKAGYTGILDEQGLVYDGKAEGMLIGTMLARLAGKKYIGFVDADNYFPGAVEEYIREYAAGFIISQSKYSMVRIAWHSKPKIAESKLFFRKWGRTTSNTNQLLNKLIAHYTGYETEIIKTGNAGEHALTADLALNIDYSAGYSIEPYHIVNILEKFGGILESPLPDIMMKSIEIYQIESRNPHLHEAGDQTHIDEMRREAMQVIYHSPICPDSIKREIKTDALKRGFIGTNKIELDRCRNFPALSSIDTEIFLQEIASTPYGRLLADRSVTRQEWRIV